MATFVKESRSSFITSRKGAEPAVLFLDTRLKTKGDSWLKLIIMWSVEITGQYFQSLEKLVQKCGT